MSDRATAPRSRVGRGAAGAVAGATPPPGTASVDLVCCVIAKGELAALVYPGDGRRAAQLPWAPIEPGTGLEAAAARLVRTQLGTTAAWSAQLMAITDGGKHPSGAAFSVGYVAVMPAGTPAPNGRAWMPIGRLPALPPRQQMMVTAAVGALRDRMDLAPIAFRLLPTQFTLSELQQAYELLLGRRLHKASFRRALQAAYLVEPTDSWRSEGRGRPAQLFRYAPRRRRGVRRSVRFELLG